VKTTGQQTRTYQVIHQPITPHNDHIPLFHLPLFAMRILHRLIPAVRSQLERPVEGVLHFFGPAYDLSVADEEDTAVAYVGDAERGVVEDCEETSRGAVDTL
jgi:hypothetical protein